MIFKAYDIRGIYPEEINEKIAYKIGRAFVKFLQTKEVVVGKDMRDSSETILESLKKGIMDEGANVIDIGLCTTPMLYFGIFHYNYSSGIMITASHNPKEYNGLKLCKEKAIPLSGETGIKEIKALVEKNEFTEKEKGSYQKKDITKDYQDYILKDFPKLPYKIVVDAANAMGALDVEILKRAGVEVTGLYLDLDGNFPNHEANPLKEETLDAIKELLKKGKYDLGIAFDGDADRAMFLTEKGEFLAGDITTAIITESLCKEGDSILYDLRSTKAVPETIKASKGKPIISRVGHAFIKQTMKEHDAVFGGEVSGHYYFKKMGYCESAILASLHILSIIKEKKQPLSEIAKTKRTYYQSGEINFKVEDKEKVMEKLIEAFPEGKITKLDGISIELDKWWFNVRPSNTEPLLRLNLEADTKEEMETNLKKVKNIIIS